MRLKYFGDSYDIVKKSFIEWLGGFGAWSAHPMFTEPVTTTDAQRFSKFMGAELLTTAVLGRDTNRAEYFAVCKTADNLFLDPDTGVRLSPCRGSKSVNYVFAPELVALSHERPDGLTLVFDQSFSRDAQARLVKEKLAFFQSQSVHGFFYYSHAPLLLLCADPDKARQVHERLLHVSGLPLGRIVSIVD